MKANFSFLKIDLNSAIILLRWNRYRNNWLISLTLIFKFQLETVVTITTLEVQVAGDGDDVDIINQVVSELPEEEEEDELFDEQYEGENPSLEL